MEAIIRGSADDRTAYEWAVKEQGYTGTWADWCRMDISERMDYEAGAAGHDEPRQVINNTPGPWTHEPSTQARYSWLVLTADFDEDAGRGTVLCRTSDGISEADARLISAAPELLEAARKALAYIENPRFGIVQHRNTLDSLHIAIAKAEGRSN